MGRDSVRQVASGWPDCIERSYRKRQSRCHPGPGMRFSLLGINALLRPRNAYFSGSWTRSGNKSSVPMPLQSLSVCLVREISRIWQDKSW